jgi:hypothetical protein
LPNAVNFASGRFALSGASAAMAHAVKNPLPE